MTDHERRILAYLDQRGRSHRGQIVRDLASPESRIGSGKWPMARWNAACALIFGAWSKRLAKEGLIEMRFHSRGFYECHAITPAGRRAIRSAPPREDG
jgi:hypothetical protein